MSAVEAIEDKLFLEGLYLRFNLDFRACAPDYTERQLKRLRKVYCQPSLLQLLDQIINFQIPVSHIVHELTVGTTEFFRDPEVYKYLGDQVFPFLKTYPSLKIWSAGCSTGQELLSLLVMLHEHDLLDRSTIYASDLDAEVLERARRGIFSQKEMQQFVHRYGVLSNKAPSTDYYLFEEGKGFFNKSLLNNVIFLEHDLMSQDCFEQFHLIFCRNVLIYFDRKAQEDIGALLQVSLKRSGFLVLGKSETLKLPEHSVLCNRVNRQLRIYQRQ